MINHENGCVDCGRPCLGNNCPNRRAVVLVCDKCGNEVEELFWIETENGEEQYCSECVLDSLEKVDPEVDYE